LYCSQAVSARLSQQNLDQYLASVREKKVMMEERRRQAEVERAERELAQCTFSPQTNPLPRYLCPVHMSQSSIASQQDGAQQQGYREALQQQEYNGWDSSHRAATPTKHLGRYESIPEVGQHNRRGLQQLLERLEEAGAGQEAAVVGSETTTVILNEQLRTFKERLAELQARLLS
jgi:uncharacterized protein YidB (DUF937 family)